MTLRGFLTYLVIVVSFLSCSHQAVPVKPVEEIDVHGHRGARGARAENSLPAFEYALKVGADVLELDTVVTGDDVVIVTHDLQVDWKLCDGPRQIEKRGDVAYRSLTLKEVKTLRCGVKPHPRFPKQKLAEGGVKIPTLREVFRMVAASESSDSKDIRFNIETKIVPSKPSLSPTPEKFAHLVYEVIHDFKLQRRVILQSFDYRTLKAMKQKESTILTAQLIYGNYLDFVDVLLNQGVDYLSPHHAWLTEKTVRDLHQVGIRVVPWTANSPEVWERLAQINVDGIITDHPKDLIKYFSRRSEKRSSP